MKVWEDQETPVDEIENTTTHNTNVKNKNKGQPDIIKKEKNTKKKDTNATADSTDRQDKKVIYKITALP